MTLYGFDPGTVAAVALVVALVVTRTYFGSGLLSLRFLTFWALARSLYMPVVDRVAKRVVGVPAENHAVVEEHAGDASVSALEVARRIDAASEPPFEVSVLSGYKTDWQGNEETASIVAFVGPLPFAGAPRWLRAEQVHVTMFTVDGATRVTAHREANAWRPDKWRDHLRAGASFDRQAGVNAVREWMRSAHPVDA